MRQATKIAITFLTMVGMGNISPAIGESVISDDFNAIRSEIRALQEGQRAIQEDLEAIKDLLKARKRQGQSVQDVSLTLNVTDDPSKGKPKARVTLIEFTDYQCPYCSRHTFSVLPQLEKSFIETGKIQYVLRDFPIASIHPYAVKAHEAAHCAGEEGKYWEMHDQLFANQKALQAEHLAGYARKAGVSDDAAFQACVESGKYHKLAQRSIAEGTKAGVRGTPSFLLGLTDGEGNVQVLKLIRGAQPYPVFQEHITNLLTHQD
jgi:protein-disulfide isomerase